MGYGMASGSWGMYSFMAVFIQAAMVIIFIIVAISIAMRFVRSNAQWRHNNQSPTLTVPVKLVAKRTEGQRTRMRSDDFGDMGLTFYYATFEFENGDRQEFTLDGKGYGLLAEGDEGRLTFQGTCFKGFERNRPDTVL